MSYTLIAPKLFSIFSCIADKCPANCCCAGWSITWTRAEYERLCSAPLTDEIRNKLETSFTDGDYPVIKADENGECPFLGKDSLCEIQKTAGEEYLSYTCRQYPRISRLCGDVMLSSCKATCYAVMKTLFSDESCMMLSEKQTTAPAEAIVTPASQVSKRKQFFDRIKEQLWSDIGFIYNIGTDNEIKQHFSQRFGWDIITAETSALPGYVKSNIVKAAAVQWIITRFDPDATEDENTAELFFLLRAVSIAADGAAACADSEEQLFCSICDFVSAVI